MSGSPSQYVPNHWWSRSKPPKHSRNSSLHSRSSPSLPHELENDSFAEPQYKHSSRFNTLASVIGLKPKKHSIVIQDPPPDSLSLYSPVSYTSQLSRPLSKAVSSITDEDAFEPRTPSDARPSYTKSIMTISDPDPFASNSVIVSHNNLHDPSRLSVLSDTSASKHSVLSDSPPDHRQSYASTSSHGHYPVLERLISEPSLSSPITSLPTDVTTNTMMIRTRLDGDRKRWDRETTAVSPPLSPTPSSIRSPVSDTFVVPPKRRSSVRPRGMTDVGSPRQQKHPNGVPLILVRQSSRTLVAPTSPPPSQALPPVPSLDPSIPQSSRLATASPAPSSSSSSLSFAWSVSDNEAKMKPRQKRQDDRGEQLFNVPRWALDSPPPRVPKHVNTVPPARTASPPIEVHGLLRKAVSQRSMHRVGSPPIPTSSVDDTSGSLKGPKKQRSSGHTRMHHLPTLRHAHSFTPSETSPSSPENPRDKEKERQKENEKRESNASLTRKRIFSPSTRRSSSQINASTIDDDSRSVMSLPVENDPNPSLLDNCISSPKSEPTVLPSATLDELPASPTERIESHKGSDSISDYTPQHIMSPADMLKLEADINNASLSDMKISGGAASFDQFGLTANINRINMRRARGSSITDSATSDSTATSSTFTDRMETSSPISFFDQQSSYFRTKADLSGLAPSPSPPRSGSTISYSASTSPSLWPSISQGTFINNSGGDRDQLFSSLPPPPRRRPVSRQHSEGVSTKRSNTAQMQSLSPPTIRRNKSANATPVVRSTTFTSSVEVKVPNSSFGNTFPRRSIMKKPSFLDIDDEVEADMGARNGRHRRMRSSASVEDSFLDLGRGSGSFDTIRTASTESQG